MADEAPKKRRTRRKPIADQLEFEFMPHVRSLSTALALANQLEAVRFDVKGGKLYYKRRIVATGDDAILTVIAETMTDWAAQMATIIKNHAQTAIKQIQDIPALDLDLRHELQAQRCAAEAVG